MIPRIFLLILFLSFSVAAQTPNDEVKKGFIEVNDWVVKAAEMVPTDKYSYEPTDTVRTFGQLIAHITDSYNYFCASAVGSKMEGPAVEKGSTDKDTLLPKLKEAVGRCSAAYDAKNAQFAPLFGNVGHTNLHYGNIITYMRMLGLKPPSS
ncbi:MAG TPA: DinB family protein [Pyrinomonadaceae bacterium]|nr:DinB family protein [Pyrinomonadaceae bacterium]